MSNSSISQPNENAGSYIPDIYQYCDNWCKKCPFTGQCEMYKFNKHLSPGDDDPVFMRKILKNARKIKGMIEDIANKYGIELDNLPAGEEDEKKVQEREEYSKNHLLSKTAKRYTELSMGWFEHNRELIMNSGNQLLQNMELDIRPEESEKEATEVFDAFELIGWYSQQIHLRLAEAVSLKYDKKQNTENNDEPTAADGQAKIALIEIESSLVAWNKLRQYFPKASDEILDIQVFLENLKKNTEKHFPKARDFIRPGFDEIGQD